MVLTLEVFPIIGDASVLLEAVFVILESVIAFNGIPTKVALHGELVCLSLGSVTIAARVEVRLNVSSRVLQQYLSWNDEGIQLIC